MPASAPSVIAICGSMQNADHIASEARRLTGEGYIVLVPIAGSTLSRPRLNELHLRRIDMADRVHVVGRPGEDTQAEIEYALQAGKPVSCHPYNAIANAKEDEMPDEEPHGMELGWEDEHGDRGHIMLGRQSVLEYSPPFVGDLPKNIVGMLSVTPASLAGETRTTHPVYIDRVSAERLYNGLAALLKKPPFGGSLGGSLEAVDGEFPRD